MSKKDKNTDKSKLNKFVNALKKMRDVFKKISITRIIRKPYYYVPPCPKCKSPMTGKFVRELHSEYETDWRLKSSLKNGEIIAPGTKNGKECFCLNCGHEWNDIVELKFWTIEKINEQKELRKTKVMYDNYEGRQEKETKKKSAFSRYVGHM